MVKTTIKIDGMMCEKCEAHVTEAIKGLYPDLKKIKTSKDRGESVLITEDPVDEESIKKAVTESGYTYVTLIEEPYKRLGLF